VQNSDLMSTFLTQGHYLGFASSLQLQTERQAKLLVAIPLQEFALDYRLFMMMPKRLSQATQPKHYSETVSTGALQKFIRLVSDQTRRKYLTQKKQLQKPQLQKPRCPDSRETVVVQDNILKNNIPKNTGPKNAVPKTTVAKRPAAKEITSKQIARKTATAPASLFSEAACSDISAVYLQSPNLLVRSKPASPEILTLAIGTQNKTIQTVTAGVIIQQLGLLEHFLPREGRYRNTEYQIKWRDFTSGAPIVAGLQAQQLDIGILGDYPLLLSATPPTDSTATLANTRLISFVASNPDGAGNTIIVPDSSSLSSLDDLRSRVIAVPFASSAHGMMMRTLSRENLLQAVTLTSIENLSIHRLTPRKPQADGYAYFAPLHDIASHHGRFRRLLDNDLNKLPTFHGIVVRETLAEQHPDIVVAYLKALMAAQHWYMMTPSALSLVSNWARLDPDIVAKTLDYQQSDNAGIFFPETNIRIDWVIDHIQQLKTIPGNEPLGDIDVNTWIQSEFLETAIASF
ncbi:MAG: ABC transporter substrate-binding protein, partial [Cyanobacteria bacterium P01_F01_bin.4]